MSTVPVLMTNYAQALTQPVFDYYGPMVIRTATSEVVINQFKNLAGAYASGPTSLVIAITYPYVADRVGQVTKYMLIGGAPQAELATLLQVTKDFYVNNVDLIKLLFSLLTGNPDTALIYRHGRNMIKAVLLDTACQQLNTKTSSYPGAIAYALSSAKIIPNAPYFTLPVARGLCNLANQGRSLLSSCVSAKSVPQAAAMGIDLDDFKKLKSPKTVEDDFEMISSSDGLQEQA